MPERIVEEEVLQPDSRPQTPDSAYGDGETPEGVVRDSSPSRSRYGLFEGSSNSSEELFPPGRNSHFGNSTCAVCPYSSGALIN